MQPLNVPYIFVTLIGIAGAVVSEVQLSNVNTISVTLFGITGAVVREVQLPNVERMLVTGCPAISESISPYAVLEVSFTLTPQPLCDDSEDQES